MDWRPERVVEKFAKGWGDVSEQGLEHDFLEDVADSFRRRSKSLKHKTCNLALERIVERWDDGEQRKLEIACTGSDRAALRLHVWEDRWVWVDARKASKRGWVWVSSSEGCIFGEDQGRRLVAAFEATIQATFDMTSNETGRFDLIWRPILANGPR